ncbi:NADPH-dependent F420 reductase [Nocardioides sp. GCM10028917]|uniref:NADPH-dependent F420 reductase n=1 Tax=Nocardioides sp. GCM10028917 TaxID=3273408 RepID=UPI003616968A
MSTTPRPVIGIFGAGKVGIALARLAVDAGYTVHIASSGTTADTAGITRFFAPAALPADGDDLPGLADVLVIAVPLRRFRELPLAAMAGRIVIDAMNYWPPIDGTLPEFQHTHRPTSTIVRDALPPTARLVKTFNHLGYHQLQELPRPAGATDRVALAVAGDDPRAVETVAEFMDDLGFDPVTLRSLEDSDMLEAGSSVFGQPFNQHQLRRALGIDRAA